MESSVEELILEHLMLAFKADSECVHAYVYITLNKLCNMYALMKKCRKIV